MGIEVVSLIQRYDFYNSIQTRHHKAHDAVATTQEEQEKFAACNFSKWRAVGRTTPFSKYSSIYIQKANAVQSVILALAKQITEGLNILNNQGKGNRTSCQSDELA